MCVRFANQIVTFSVPWGQCVSVWTGALYQRGLQMETKIFGGFIFKSTSWQELHFLLAIIPDKFLEHNEPKLWHNPVNVWITPEENQWVWAHPKEWKEVSIEIFLLWPLCAIVMPARKIAFNASELRSTVEVNSNVYNCVASNKSSDKSEDSQQTPCWWKQEVNAKLWYYISSWISKVRRALCLHTFSCFMQIQW